MDITEITIPDEELGNLSVGQTKSFDFDEGVILPEKAYLKDSSGEIFGTAEREKRLEYFGGRIVAQYRITEMK